MIRHSVTFSLLHRERRDGTRSVQVTVTWVGHRVRHTLPVSAPSDAWDAVRQRARNTRTFRGAEGVNAAIQDAGKAVSDLFTRCRLEGRMPSPSDVTAVFGHGSTEDRRTVASAIRDFIARQSVDRSWQPTTAYKFRHLGDELASAGLLYLDQLDDAGQGAFYAHLMRRGLRNSTAQKKAALLHWFLRWCGRQGWIMATLSAPHFRTVPRRVLFLEWDELMHFYTFDFGSLQHLANVRDVFCFCAFTGLRFSDAARLRPSDIADGEIRVVTQKTADPLTIPLNKYASAILSRTFPSPSSGLLLPVISNQNSNYQLKDAAMLAQLDRPVSEVYYVGSERLERTSLAWEVITTHWARRTFVVNALRLGIPAEVVMKFTGHSSYAAMRPYIDVADETKRRFMSLFDA